MEVSHCIEQKGVIKEIRSNTIFVEYFSSKACGNCSANTLCSLGKDNSGIIEIFNNSNAYRKGEIVKILIKKSLGYKAVFLGYLLPLILLLVILISTSLAKLSELLTGLFALSVLPLYYFILYLNKEKVQKGFVFKIEKSTEE